MLIREANILNKTKKQYLALNDAIFIDKFLINTAIRYGRDNSE